MICELYKTFCYIYLVCLIYIPPFVLKCQSWLKSHFLLLSGNSGVPLVLQAANTENVHEICLKHSPSGFYFSNPAFILKLDLSSQGRIGLKRTILYGMECGIGTTSGDEGGSSRTFIQIAD